MRSAVGTRWLLKSWWIRRQKNINAIAEMESVTSIRGDEFKMGDGCLLTDVTASFAAIPAVLEYGRVAGLVANKGGKGFDSATVVAPITIGKKPYMMGVIVHRSNGENRFYVHDVFAIKEEAAPLITGTHNVGETGGATSAISIIRKILSVKAKDKEPRLVVILDEKGKDGQNLLAVMELYAPISYPGVEQRRNHVLITVYEKSSLPEYIKMTVDKNRIMHIRKGVSAETAASLQLAGAESEETLKRNVARFNKKVKAFKQKNKIQYYVRNRVDGKAAEVLQKENKGLNWGIKKDAPLGQCQ